MPGHTPRMSLEVQPHASRARLGRTHRANTPAFPPPTWSGPSPVPSHPPPEFPHAPPVFTGPPGSLHSRAARTVSRMAQIDRWPSHFVTRAEWHRFARRARPHGARTSLGRGPSPRAGAPLAPAGAPLRTGGAPHFFACAPPAQTPVPQSESPRLWPSVPPCRLGTARLQPRHRRPPPKPWLGVFTRGATGCGARPLRLCQNLFQFLQGFLSELI